MTQDLMETIVDAEGDAKQILDGKRWHVWVVAYGISHGRRMELALHHGTFPKFTGLICTGVTYFKGRMEGGPYDLRFVEETSVDGPIIAILDEAEDFVLKCSAIQVGKIRYQ